MKYMGSLPGRTQLGMEVGARLVFMRLLMLLASDRGTNAGARELIDAYRLLRRRI